MERFTYKGAAILENIKEHFEATDEVGFAGSIKILERFEDAFRAGLSLSQSAEATLLAYQMLDMILNTAGTIDQIDPQWNRETAERIDATWLARIPLLEVDDQISAYNVVDRIFASLCQTVGSGALNRAERVFRTSPVPAPNCAFQVMLANKSHDEIKPICVEAAKIVDSYTSSPEQRATLQYLKGKRLFGFMNERAGLTGTDRKEFDELLEFDRFLTRHFGAEISLSKLGFFASESKKLAAAEERAELYKRLRMAAMDVPSSTFSQMYETFLQARIDAGTNEVKKARKTFRKLYEARFAVIDTASYLGVIHNFLKEHDETLALIPEAASYLLVLKGEIGAKNLLGEAYEDAGGHAANLGLTEYPQSLHFECKQAWERLVRDCKPALEKQRAKFVDEFWAAREKQFRKFVAATFKGTHFDALHGIAGAPVEMTIDPVQLGLFMVDENPALECIDRGVLIEASAHPVKTAAVVAQIVKYLAREMQKGSTFQQIAAEFPGYGHSLGVCMETLKPSLDRKDAGALTALLDFIEKLPGEPDMTVAEIYRTACPVLALAKPPLDVVNRAVALLGRIKNDKAVSIVSATGLEQAFGILADPAHNAIWRETCERVMQVWAGAGTTSRISTWILGELRKNPTDSFTVSTGEFLTGAIGGPQQESIRRAVADSLYRILGGEPDATALGIYTRFCAVAGEDADFQQKTADWYTGRLTASGAASSTIALGEKLIPEIPEGTGRAAVVQAVLGALKGQLDRESVAGSARGLIERILKLTDRETGAAASVGEWYVKWAGAQAPGNDVAELGEWLHQGLKGQPRDSVTVTCAAVLNAMISVAEKNSQRLPLLERLVELCPDDTDAGVRLAAARKARTKFMVTVGLIVGGALALVIVAIAVFGG